LLSLTDFGGITFVLGLGPDFIFTGLLAGASEVSDFDNSEMFRFREGV
jgi:hypothetical protein